MFEEAAFKKKYREAYDRITPDKDCIQRIMEEAGAGRRSVFRANVCGAAVRTAAAASAVFCLLAVISLPAAAKTFPTVYKIIERYVPALKDYVLPTETGCTSNGITMQVEAVNVEGTDADILISFSDAAGSSNDVIKGKADMYGGYSLKSYGVESAIGGCTFLEYDKAEDKAYFKIDVSAADEFDNTKLTFRASHLLTNCTEEKQWISLEETVINPATKEVTLNGRGGNWNSLSDSFGKAEAEDGLYRPTAHVLDLQKADNTLAEALTVTGIGYEDGVLRVQACRGNLTDADRHLQPFLVDAEGSERHENCSVSWREEGNGERFSFTEHWFLVEESELKNRKLYGIFFVTEGSVKGDWEVTFQIE